MRNTNLRRILRRLWTKKLFVFLCLCLFAAVGIFFYLICFTAYESYTGTGSFLSKGSRFPMPFSVLCSSFVICLVTLCALTCVSFFLVECYQGYYDWLTLMSAFSAFGWLADYSLSLSCAPVSSVSFIILSLFLRNFYVIPLLFFLWTHRNSKHRFLRCSFYIFAGFCTAFLFMLLIRGIVLGDSLPKFLNLFLSDGNFSSFSPWNRMLAVCFFLFYAFHIVRTVYHHFLRRKLAMQSLELKQQHSSESLLYLQTYLKQASMLRHDIRHHFAVLRYYLGKGETAQASSYLDELIRREISIVPYVQTSNELINVLLNSWLLSAQEDHIDIRFQNLTAPAHLCVSAPDLCSLLSNLLENAKEACRKAPESATPFLSLEMYVKKDFFIISCKNSYYHTLIADKKGRFLTTKEHADSHGFGLYIVEKTAEKYNGFLSIQAENGIFCAAVALKIGDPSQPPCG